MNKVVDAAGVNCVAGRICALLNGLGFSSNRHSIQAKYYRCQEYSAHRLRPWHASFLSVQKSLKTCSTLLELLSIEFTVAIGIDEIEQSVAESFG